MCDPVTIAAVATVAASTMGAYQQVQQGKYQKDVADYNARTMENEAVRTRNVGVEQENIQRERTAQLISKQRAQLGASNVELDSGSALQLQEDAETLGEADALRIRSNFEDKATALETNATLTRDQGEQAEDAGYMQGFSTLLGGIGQAGMGVSNKWYTPKSTGVA